MGPDVFCASPGAGLPALLAGAGVQAHHVAVGRGVKNHVLINGQRLGARGARGGGRNLALVLPDEIAIGGVQRLDDGARFHQIHHAVMDDRNGFAGAGAQAARPRHAQLADVGAGHLLERAEALRVVSAAVHQPVVRAGMQEHVLGHRNEIFHHLRVCAHRDRSRQQEIPKHAGGHCIAIARRVFSQVSELASKPSVCGAGANRRSGPRRRSGRGHALRS